MQTPVEIIPLPQLVLSFAPVLIVAIIMWRWSSKSGLLAWATARMLLQLVAIGYVLTFIFAADHVPTILLVLAVMLMASSWIAIRPLKQRSPAVLTRALVAIAVGGLVTLALVLGGVLNTSPWYSPQITVPVAGMIFSSAMNTVSLAAERLELNEQRGLPVSEARIDALNTAMIPMINAFLAVGLVALPGMMTGQILAGVEPHVAVRYQIVVMCMTFGAAGISAAVYLSLSAKHQTKTD